MRKRWLHLAAISKQELRKAADIRPNGLVIDIVKTIPTNSCHWNCSIQKGRFTNCLKYNSEEESLQI